MSKIEATYGRWCVEVKMSEVRHMQTVIRALRANGFVVKGRVKDGGRRLSQEGDLITFLLQRRGLSEKGKVSKGFTIPLF